MSRLAIIGGGFMGTAIARGLLESGSWEPEDIVVAEVRESRRTEVARLDVRCVEHAADVAGLAPTVLLAVKPQDMATTLDMVAPVIKPDTLCISIAAGIRLAVLEAALPGIPVIRVMPNTPAARRAGAAALAPGAHDREVVELEPHGGGHHRIGALRGGAGVGHRGLLRLLPVGR